MPCSYIPSPPFPQFCLSRRILSTTTVAAIQVEEQALLTHNCAEQGPATESESTALHVSAVRNVLLAVTKQPLVPGIPAAGRQQVRRSRMVEGGRHFDSPTNDICLGDSFASSIGSIRTRMSDRSTSEATTSATATATAAASSSRKTPGSQRQDDRCCARGSSYQNFDETAGEGFGNSQQPDLLRLSPEGRASRRYSEAGGAVAAASRVPAVSDGQGHGERDGERDGEEEERSSAHAYREERHWQSSPPQHYEIERKEEYLLYLEEERGGSMPEKHTTGGCEEGAEEQLQQGGETLLVSPVRGSQSTTGGVRTTAHITTDPFGDDCGDQQRHTGVPQQSRSRRTGVGGRGGKGGLVQSMASSAGTGGEPRDTARRSGVDEVWIEHRNLIVHDRMLGRRRMHTTTRTACDILDVDVKHKTLIRLLGLKYSKSAWAKPWGSKCRSNRLFRKRQAKNVSLPRTCLFLSSFSATGVGRKRHLAAGGVPQVLSPVLIGAQEVSRTVFFQASIEMRH